MEKSATKGRKHDDASRSYQRDRSAMPGRRHFFSMASTGKFCLMGIFAPGARWHRVGMGLLPTARGSGLADGRLESLWPPFCRLGGKGEWVGIRRIFDKTGLSPTFRCLPWARVLHLIERQQLDVAMGARYPGATFTRFSAPYRRAGIALRRRQINNKKATLRSPSSYRH